MKIKDAFDPIRPDEELIRDTKAKMMEAARFVQAEEHRRRRNRRLTAGLSAAAAVLIAASGAAYTYLHMPVSTLYMDINPSFELRLDRRSRVTEALCLNEDAASLLDAASLKGKTADEAVDSIMESADLAGYFPQDTVSVVSLAMAENDSGLSLLSECAKSVEETYDLVAVYTSAYDQETLRAADEMEISPGKYGIVSMVSALDGGADIEELKTASVTSLFDRLEDLAPSGSGLPMEGISHVTDRRQANAPCPESTARPEPEAMPSAAPANSAVPETAGTQPASSMETPSAPVSSPDRPAATAAGASPDETRTVPETAETPPAAVQAAPETAETPPAAVQAAPEAGAALSGDPPAGGPGQVGSPQEAPSGDGQGAVQGPEQNAPVQDAAPMQQNVPVPSADEKPNNENFSYPDANRQESAPSGANPSNNGPSR